MIFRNFVGGSYRAASGTGDDERTINWFPEVIKSDGAPAQAMLLPTPGVATLSSGALGWVPGVVWHPEVGRAHLAAAGREWAVIGVRFVEFNTHGRRVSKANGTTLPGYADGSPITLQYDANPATLSYNGDGGNQIFITSGGYAYIYNILTDRLTEVTTLRGKATMGAFLEGYFLCLDANTSTWYYSALYDGTSWTLGTDYVQRSVQPDPWLALKVVGRYVWLLGETSSECWYNTGGTTPFAMHPSGAINYGIAAPWSAALLGSEVVWLARTSTGRKCVVKASGFTPEIISNLSLESELQGYDSVEDAVGDAYSDGGHTFYLLHCDRQDVTWAWDGETGLWCERGHWISKENRFSSWRPRYYAYAYDQHRMLDARGDSLYRISSDIATDVGGDTIRRVRRAPALNQENKDIYYSSFELDLERGQTTSSATNPQVMLRLSNDGGRTWIAESWRSAGKTGEYSQRVRWTRLGKARRRVFEVSVSDGIPWKLTGAYLETAGG